MLIGDRFLALGVARTFSLFFVASCRTFDVEPLYRFHVVPLCVWFFCCCFFYMLLLSVCSHATKHTSALEEPMNRPEKELEKDKLRDDFENGKLYQEDPDAKGEIKESDCSVKAADDD